MACREAGFLANFWRFWDGQDIHVFFCEFIFDNHLLVDLAMNNDVSERRTESLVIPEFVEDRLVHTTRVPSGRVY